MVRLKSAKGMILLSVGLLLFVMFFMFLFEVAINPAVIITSMLFIGFAVFAIIFFTKRSREKDDMVMAIRAIRPKWKELTEENLMMRDSSGYERYFPPDDTKFLGFVFKRTLGHRAGKFMAIVVAKRQGRYDIVKYRELADEEDKRDPFSILQTRYSGSPTASISPEAWQTTGTAPIQDGPTINIDRRDEWKDTDRK